MANEIKMKLGTPLTWADVADNPSNLPWDENYDMPLGGLANAGAAQGAKGDLGELRARNYAVRVGVELDIDLSAAGTVDVYWSASSHPQSGKGNTGGASGLAEAYTVSAICLLEHLQLIGVLPMPATCDDDIVYQGIAGIFTPSERYGMPILVNNSTQAFQANGSRIYVSIVPMIDEVQ